MSPAAAQLQFGAEFLGFLAATAGIALALLRTHGRRASALVPLGFVGLAAAAFLAGSRLVDGRDHWSVSVSRVAGAALVLVGAFVWDTETRVRAGLMAGAAITSVATPLAIFGLDLATDAVVAAGAVAIGIAALDQARRSVASRIAVSSAATLLLLVVVLSVSLSAVIDTNLRSEATRRLDERTRLEAQSVRETLANAIRFIDLARDNVIQRQSIEALARQAAAGKADSSLTADLQFITSRYQGQAYVLLTPDGKVLSQVSARTNPLDAAGLVALIGSEVVRTTSCLTPQVTVLVIGGKAFGTSTVALCDQTRTRIAGRFVALNPLDDSYLDGRTRAAGGAGGQSYSFQLFATGGPVAAFGPQPPPAEARALATAARGAVKDNAVSRSAIIDDRFVSAVPVVLQADKAPEIVIMASLPTTTIEEAQQRLFTTLFVLALVGTLIALALAAVVGERIGSRLRQLTAAAEGVSRGDPGVRAGLGGEDEVGTLGATFDAMAFSIEEKTAAELGLRSRIEAVVAGMAEALVATDEDARITDFNQAAEDLVGISAAAARGRDVHEVVTLAGDDGTDLQARLKRPPRTRWSASGTLQPLDGAPVPVAASGGPLRAADGHVVGGVVLLRDLRGEREIERMKTEFLSRIGHELRTPLTGVMGYADLLLRREWPPERSRMMLEEVHASARRLERIVELLEFFAAAAAGRTLLRLHDVDVRALVDSVYREWQPQLEPPIVLARKLGRGLPHVVADPRWLTMALHELVDNARKFSPGGGRIVIGAQETDDGRVEVFVADRGVGMSAEEVKVAFDDFQQGDTSDTRSFGGLGLGLPLVQRVAEGHGGEVRCSTTPGRGTRLAIVLPVASP